MRRYFVFVLLAVGLFACRGPKYYVKEAQKYEKTKDYDQAVAHYAEAYSLDPNNKEAKKGLKKTGQKLLDQLLNEVKDLYEDGNYQQAVEKYKKTEKYYDNVKNRGVELDFPEDGRILYKSALDNYLKGLYLDAANAINNGDYVKAKSNIADIRKNDPGYEGLSLLERALEADPLYTEGLSYYSKGQKLLSIQYFNKVNAIYPGYRETNKFITELSSLPKQKIALFPVENKSREAALDRLLSRGLEKRLFNVQSELLTIGDETMVQNELLKANKPSQPPYEDNTILQISKNMSATRSVVINITDFTEEALADNENFQLAYLRERVTYWDPYYGQTTNWQWREIRYKEIEESAKYAIYIKIRIFDTQSGTLIYNDVITKSVINKLKYATFDGDYNELYPTMGYITQTELNKWRARFNAEKDKKSRNELVDILINAAGDEIYSIIMSKLSY